MKKDYVEVTSEVNREEELAFVEQFWTQRWEGTAKLPSPERVARSPEYRVIEPFLAQLPKRAKILDGGCGLGAWVVHLANQGFDATGIDISRRTVARLCELLPGYRFAHGDIRAMDLPDASFDAYYSWGTFEHFEDGLGACINEAYRILRLGGWLFVSVPYQNRRHLRRDLGPLHRTDPFYDRAAGYRRPLRFYQWRLTKPELQRELESRGFRCERIRPIHKASGVSRWLQWDFPLFKEGTKLFALAVRAFSLVFPADYISHMILAVARKVADRP